MAELTGMTAVVTGAATGIGAAIALRFAREGAAVAVIHHRQAKLARAVVDPIVRMGGCARAFAVDVRSEAQVNRTFDAIVARFGVPDILVNSAGIDAAGIAVADMTAERFEEVWQTNVLGPFHFIRAFLRARGKRSTPARIINVSSVHEDVPRAGAADYCASKGALRNLTRCLALELAEQGVTVNNLCPGMILTPMNQAAIDDPKVRAREVASIPQKRAGEPEEVAALALYLASAAARYATGASFFLDGGLQLNLGQGA